jgi:hypothetical protein
MSTDRDREGEKLVISVGACRRGMKTEEEKNRLITELADAIRNGVVIYPYTVEERDDLLQRAREATK